MGAQLKRIALGRQATNRLDFERERYDDDC
jgi:hypothetical protein